MGIVLFLLSLNFSTINCTAQTNWSFGVSFIPIKTNYAFGAQNVNYNLLSGVAFRRYVSPKITADAKIFFWRSKVYSDSSTMWNLKEQQFTGHHTYQGAYLQIFLGVNYFPPRINFFNQNVFIKVGVSQVISLTSESYIFLDNNRTKNNLTKIEKRPESTYFNIGIGIQKDLGKNVKFDLYPIYQQAVDPYFDDRYSLFTYNQSIGLGLSIKKYL